VVERARSCQELDDVIVATDDQRIADVVQSFGGKAVMTKSDHPSGTDRIAEAVEADDADLIVNIQGDEPLLDSRLVDRLVARMRDEEWDMGTAAAPIVTLQDLEDSSVVKVIFGMNAQALYFSRSVIPYNRDGGTKLLELGIPVYWRHIGIYAYRRSFLFRFVSETPCLTEQTEKLEQLRALHIGCRMLVVTAEKPSLGVDTEKDLVEVTRILEEHLNAEKR
jgi:3-deoxy-manno-octulosonate cytidylyltransferase (CMP-KDO synthetase)